MPGCGSQVVLCSLPVRFDSHLGCGFKCVYCFASRKRDLANVSPGEGVKALRDWIGGRRTTETNWCDWDIPLHWGGMSDPFQPAEIEHRRSRACLDVFAETGYPVAISTKSTLLTEPQYRDRLRACNAAVQVSMVAPQLDAQEPGAPRFAQRMKMLPRLARAVRRLVVRIQPYRPDLLRAVLRALPRYAAAGVYGVTMEGLKLLRAAPGMVKLGAEFVYPAETLQRDFEAIRARCHELGLRFYAAENRFRGMGDDTCCCGVADLAGWRVNGANINALVEGRRIPYTRRMRAPGTAGVFKALAQNAVSTTALKDMSYRDAMEIVHRVPVYREIMGLDCGGGERINVCAGAGGMDRDPKMQPVGRSGWPLRSGVPFRSNPSVRIEPSESGQRREAWVRNSLGPHMRRSGDGPAPSRPFPQTRAARRLNHGVRGRRAGMAEHDGAAARGRCIDREKRQAHSAQGGPGAGGDRARRRRARGQRQLSTCAPGAARNRGRQDRGREHRVHGPGKTRQRQTQHQRTTRHSRPGPDAGTHGRTLHTEHPR